MKSGCASTRPSLLETFGSGAIPKQQRRHVCPPCVSPGDPCVSRRHPIPRPLGRLIAPAARCATSAPATTPARRWASPVPLHRRLRRGDARGRRAHTARAPPLRTPTQPLGGLRVHRAVLLGPRGRRRAWGTVGEPAAAALPPRAFVAWRCFSWGQN